MIGPPVSRNSPCPCGSGKRYKDCHGALNGQAPDVTISGEASIGALLDRARSTLAAGDRTGALSLWQQILAIDPDHAESLFHLANSRREAGDARAAIAAYDRLLHAAPGHAAGLNNLGLALESAGDRERAFECYQQVLAADPKQPDALGNLANALFDRGEFEASAETYDRLFAIRVELPVPTVVRRGIALQKSRRLDAAEAAFREAARRWPDDPQILTNIGSLCIEQGRYRDADEPLTRALELDSSNAYALSMLAHARAHLCRWDRIDELFAALRNMLDGNSRTGPWRVAPLALHAMPMPPSTLLRAARQWALNFAPAMPALPPEVHIAPGERPRVGFVSTDFRQHPVAHLMLELWERLRGGRFETFAYGLVPADTGTTGQRIAHAFDRFSDLSAESATAIAQRIRADRVAVLFDLNGYTHNARPEVFAQRPAPVQINSMGFPGSLGADCYDYIHVDPFVAPLAAQQDYAERFFYMPNAYVPSDTSRAPEGPAPSRAACGLPDTGFVFCCFNNAFKILPDVFATWMQLLAALPGSLLWLLASNADAQANLRREAERSGVAGERLIFAPRIPLAEHMARHAVADLFLDTSPYGAHTTTNDALLAGVPVLTCAGTTLASRNPGSQLRAIGLPELVTSTFTEYGGLALDLARNPQRLAPLRTRLARNRRTHPLFDMARYTRDFEDGLGRLWAEHESRRPATSSDA
jgi:protein O-GlcNAc transferase